MRTTLDRRAWPPNAIVGERKKTPSLIEAIFPQEVLYRSRGTRAIAWIGYAWNVKREPFAAVNFNSDSRLGLCGVA